MTDLTTIWALAGCIGVGMYGFALILGAAIHAEYELSFGRSIAGSVIIALASGVAMMVWGG